MSEDKTINVSTIVAEIQKLSGKTLAQLAENLGFCHATISRWSSNKSCHISSRAFNDLEKELRRLRRKELNRLTELEANNA